MITYQDIKSGAVPAPLAKVDTNSIPSLIDRASKRLAEAKTSAEVLEAKAAAELALHYAKVTKAANESHADCLRIITRAEIRMANEVDRGQEVGEVAKPGRKANVPASDNKATLAELGISRQRVNEWRKVAEAGEEKVEQAISEALAEGRAPTKADVHRAAGIVKEKPQADADREYADLQAAWDKAGPLARRHFLAWNDLIEQPKVETHDAEACKPNSNAVDPASIVADGRANAGGGDVERSATRASSAVEVGATNSPDGADETGRFESGSLTEILVKPQVQVLPGTPIQGAKGGPTGMGRSDGVERHAPEFQSTVPAVEQAVAGKPQAPRPSATAKSFNNPRCLNACDLAHSRDACHDCLMAWSKRPKDEQVRLWAEAVQAARAA